MARSWKDVRRSAVDAGLIDPERVAKHRDHLEAEVRAHRLAEMRRAQHVSQSEVAKVMGVTQPRVSMIENGEIDRTELATLKGYVEALGGRVRVVAEFGDEQLTIG